MTASNIPTSEVLDDWQLNRWIGKNVWEGTDDWTYDHRPGPGAPVSVGSNWDDSDASTAVYRACGIAQGVAKKEEAWDNALLSLLQHKNKNTSQDTRAQLKELSRLQKIHVQHKSVSWELLGPGSGQAVMFIGPQIPNTAPDSWVLAANTDNTFTHIHVIVKKSDLDLFPDASGERPHWLDRKCWGPGTDSGVVEMELENYTEGEKRWWLAYPYVVGSPSLTQLGESDPVALIGLLKENFDNSPNFRKRMIEGSRDSFMHSQAMNDYTGNDTELEDCGDRGGAVPKCRDHLVSELRQHLVYVGDVPSEGIAYYLVSLPEEAIKPTSSPVPPADAGSTAALAYGPITLSPRQGKWTFASGGAGGRGLETNFQALADILEALHEKIEEVNEEGLVVVDVDMKKEAERILEVPKALNDAIEKLTEGRYTESQALLTPRAMYDADQAGQSYIEHHILLGFQDDHELATISIKRMMREWIDPEVLPNGTSTTAGWRSRDLAHHDASAGEVLGILYNADTGYGQDRIKDDEIMDITSRTWTFILHAGEIIRRTNPAPEQGTPPASLLWIGDRHSTDWQDGPASREYARGGTLFAHAKQRIRNNVGDINPLGEEGNVKVFAVDGWGIKEFLALGPAATGGRNDFGQRGTLTAPVAPWGAHQFGHPTNLLPPRDNDGYSTQTYQEYIASVKPDVVVFQLGWSRGASRHATPPGFPTQQEFGDGLAELVRKAYDGGAREFYFCGPPINTIDEELPPVGGPIGQGGAYDQPEIFGGVNPCPDAPDWDIWERNPLWEDIYYESENDPAGVAIPTWDSHDGREAVRVARAQNKFDYNTLLNNLFKEEFANPQSAVNALKTLPQMGNIEYFDSFAVTTKPASIAGVDRRANHGPEEPCLRPTSDICWTIDGTFFEERAGGNKAWVEAFFSSTTLDGLGAHRILAEPEDIKSWHCFLQSYLYPPVEIKPAPDDVSRRQSSPRTNEQIRESADDNPFKTLEQLREETKAMEEPSFRTKMARDRKKYQQLADQVNADAKKVNETISKINNISEGYQSVLQKYNIESLVALGIECIKSQVSPEQAALIPDPRYLVGAQAPWKGDGAFGIAPRFPKLPTMILPDAPVFDLDAKFYGEIEKLTKEAIFKAMIGPLLTLARELLKECIKNPANFPEEATTRVAPTLPGADDLTINLDDFQGIGAPTSAGTLEDLKDFISDLDSILSSGEICALMRGEASRLVIDLIRRFVEQSYPDSDFATFFARRSNIIDTFKMLGDKIDISFCDDIPLATEFDYSPVCAEGLRCALLDGLALSPEEIAEQCAEADARDLGKVKKLLDLLKGDIYDGAVPECLADLMGVIPEPESDTHIANKVIKFLYEPPAISFDQELSYFLFDQLNRDPLQFLPADLGAIPAYVPFGGGTQSQESIDWMSWINGHGQWNEDTRGVMLYINNDGDAAGGGADVSDRFATNDDAPDWKKRALAFAKVNGAPFVADHQGGGYAITGRQAQLFENKGSLGAMEEEPFREILSVIESNIRSIDHWPSAGATYSVIWNGFATAMQNNSDVHKISYKFEGPDDWDPSTPPNPEVYVEYKMLKPPAADSLDPYITEYSELKVRFPPAPGEDPTAFREKVVTYNSPIPESIATFMRDYAPVEIKDNGMPAGNQYIGMPVPIESFAEYVAGKWSLAFRPTLGSTGGYFETKILPKIRESFKHGFTAPGYEHGGMGKHGSGMYNDINLSIISLALDSFANSPLFDSKRLLNLDLLGSQQCPPSPPGTLLNIPKMIEEIQKKRKQNLCLQDALAAPAIEATIKAIIKIYVLDFILRVMFLFSYFQVSELVDESNPAGSLASELLKDDIIANIKRTNPIFYNQIGRFAKAIVSDKRRAEAGLPAKNELHKLIKQFREISTNVTDRAAYRTQERDSALARGISPTVATVPAPGGSSGPFVPTGILPFVPMVAATYTGSTYYISSEEAIKELIHEQLLDVSDTIQEIINPAGEPASAEEIKLGLLNDFRDGGIVLERTLGHPQQFHELVNDPTHGADYQRMLEDGTFLLEKYIRVTLKNNLPNDTLGTWLSQLTDREYIGNISPGRASSLLQSCASMKPEILLTPSGQWPEIDPAVFANYFRSWKYGLRLSYAPAADLTAIDWSTLSGATGTWTVQGGASNEFYDSIENELRSAWHGNVSEKVDYATDKTKAFFAKETITTDTQMVTPPVINQEVADHPAGTIWCRVVPTFVRRVWRADGDAVDAGGASGDHHPPNPIFGIPGKRVPHVPGATVVYTNPFNPVAWSSRGSSPSNELAKTRLSYHQDHTGQLIGNREAAHQYGWFMNAASAVASTTQPDFAHHSSFKRSADDTAANVCNELLLIGTGIHDASNPGAGHIDPSVPKPTYHGLEADHDSMYYHADTTKALYASQVAPSWYPFAPPWGDGIAGPAETVTSPLGFLVSDIFADIDYRPWDYWTDQTQRPLPYLSFQTIADDFPDVHSHCVYTEETDYGSFGCEHQNGALTLGWQSSGVSSPLGAPNPDMGPRYGGWIPFVDEGGNMGSGVWGRPGNFAAQGDFNCDPEDEDCDLFGDDLFSRWAGVPAPPASFRPCEGRNCALLNYHPTPSPGHPENDYLRQGINGRDKWGGEGNQWSVCSPGYFECGWVEVPVAGIHQSNINVLKKMDRNNPDYDNPCYYDKRLGADWDESQYKGGVRVTDVKGHDWYCIEVGQAPVWDPAEPGDPPAPIDYGAYGLNNPDFSLPAGFYTPHPAFFNVDGTLRTIPFQPADHLGEIDVDIAVNSTPLVTIEKYIPGTPVEFTAGFTAGFGAAGGSSAPSVYPAEQGISDIGFMGFVMAGGPAVYQPSLGTSYANSFDKLKELLVEKEEFKYLFDFVFPVNRLRSLAAIHGMALGLVDDLDFGFPTTRDLLKDLLEALLFGGEFKFENSSVVATGGAAALKSCMDKNASTDPKSAYNKEIAKMIFTAPLMILKGLAKLTSPNIMIAELIKNEIMQLISQIQGIVQQHVEFAEGALDAATEPLQDLANMQLDMEAEFDLALAKRGVCSTLDKDDFNRLTMPGLPPFMKTLINGLATDENGQVPWDPHTGAVNMNWQMPEALLPLKTSDIALALKPFDLLMGPGPPLGPFGLLLILFDFLEPAEREQVKQALAAKERLESGGEVC